MSEPPVTMRPWELLNVTEQWKLSLYTEFHGVFLSQVMPSAPLLATLQLTEDC